MNKKGYSLVELLCVIVILALVFLILTPIVKNVLSTSNVGALKDSIYGYVRAVNNQTSLSGYNLDNTFSINVPNSKILESGVNDIELGKVNVDGLLPDYVKLTFDDSKININSGNFCINDHSFDYSINGGVTESSNDYCTRLAGGLYTIDDVLVASWDTLINTYGFVYDTNYTNNSSSLTDYDKVSTSGKMLLSNNALSTGVKLVIPEGVTYLGENLFRNTNQLKVVVFPKSLKEIGNYAFRNDSFSGQIENIIFSYNSNLERIGRTAFMGNNNIVDLFIPKSVKTIDGNAFRGGDLTTNAMKIENVVFGYNSDLEYIGDSAFASNPYLKYIVFPNKLKIIDNYAFQYSISLTSLKIPASVTKIGDYAFEGYMPDSVYPSGYLSKIKTIEFESGSQLEYIGERAFYYNETISSISVPYNVKTIGSRAFALPKLTSVTFENTTGWTYGSSKDYISGTVLDVSNPKTNADNFKSIIMTSWLKRGE